MNANKIIKSAIVGTSAMTLFSYLVSKSKNRDFVEPDILGQLIERGTTDSSETTSKIGGWSGHYAVGFLFVIIYNELWRRKKLKPSITSGATLGAASGIVGVAAWKTMFEMHPNPPAKNLKKYFGHLILAHIVFGVFSAFTYEGTSDKRA